MKDRPLFTDRLSPRISVLLPSLNVYPYIRQCLDSVVKQTLTDMEILCIDGGSTDGTLEVLEEYAARDPRIMIIQSSRKSYGFQINLGLDAAHGDYIGIVETDDYIAHDMFQSLYSAALRLEKPDVVKSGYYQVGGSGTVKKMQIWTAVSEDVFPLTAHYELLLGHPSIWAAIYRKEFLFQKRIRMTEVPGAGWVDNPFLFRTLCEAGRIAWVNNAYYYYRYMNTGSSSAKLDHSVPLDRINEIKDYLELAFPGNCYTEGALFRRAMNYYVFIVKNGGTTPKEFWRMMRSLLRFRPGVMLAQTANWLHMRIQNK